MTTARSASTFIPVALIAKPIPGKARHYSA